MGVIHKKLNNDVGNKGTIIPNRIFNSICKAFAVKKEEFCTYLAKIAIFDQTLPHMTKNFVPELILRTCQY